MAFKFKMGRLKDFANEEEFLKDVYNKNVDAIKRAQGGYGGESFESFKLRAVGYKIHYDTNIVGGLKELAKAEAFTPQEERFRDNLREGFKKFGTMNEIKNYIRDPKTGRFAKFDYDRLKWDSESKGYFYNAPSGIVLFIDFKNSPEEIRVTRIK